MQTEHQLLMEWSDYVKTMFQLYNNTILREWREL